LFEGVTSRGLQSDWSEDRVVYIVFELLVQRRLEIVDTVSSLDGCADVLKRSPFGDDLNRALELGQGLCVGFDVREELLALAFLLPSVSNRVVGLRADLGTVVPDFIRQDNVVLYLGLRGFRRVRRLRNRDVFGLWRFTGDVGSSTSWRFGRDEGCPTKTGAGDNFHLFKLALEAAFGMKQSQVV
jgi:hypothetical protein